MESFRFKNWTIYKDAKRLFGLALKVISKLPQAYKYPIGDQLLRATLSVVLNVAEGSGKNSDRELNRFFDIANGSLNETLAVTDVLTDVKLITQDDSLEITELKLKTKNMPHKFSVISYKLIVIS